MLIECGSDKPIRLVGPRLTGAIVLKPGEAVEVPPELGQRVLRQCSQKVRISRSQWLQSWAELACMTEGVEPTDLRFQRILRALDCCDQAFAHEDWSEFAQAYQAVKALIQR